MVIPPDQFKQAMSRFASGVTIITAVTPQGHPEAFTATAFTSLSLDPPLVLFCLKSNSAIFPVFKGADRFGVNILKRDQESLSNLFAGISEDRFTQTAWHQGKHGVPLLDGCLAALELSRVADYKGGDHTIFVGQVESAELGEGEPLLYCQSKYHGIR
ncbi:MAG: flavin reductase family protein [Deltaproteobacteria bacterium]|nr:flavin reductase family protein [Deltaproteobacteria bacterium]